MEKQQACRVASKDPREDGRGEVRWSAFTPRSAVLLATGLQHKHKSGKFLRATQAPRKVPSGAIFILLPLRLCFVFALLSALFQLHSAAYVYSGLHQLHACVYGCG